MNKMADIQRKVDEALESVGNIEKAVPAPFFFTRLEARMRKDRRNFWENLSRLVTKPAIAGFTVSLVLIINVFVLIQGISSMDNMPDPSEMATTEDLRPTSYYDIENVQP